VATGWNLSETLEEARCVRIVLIREEENQSPLASTRSIPASQTALPEGQLGVAVEASETQVLPLMAKELPRL
jgi:hypothetical protein